jgi:histidine triad (HIT) family protein
MKSIRHAPVGYDCPFCHLAQGGANQYTSQDDLVYRERDVIAFMSLDWFSSTPGHVLVTPVTHHESVNDLPLELGAPLSV